MLRGHAVRRSKQGGLVLRVLQNTLIALREFVDQISGAFCVDEVMVRVAVVADGVALRDHLTRNLRQRFNPLPNQEKRGFNVVLFENIQNHGAVWHWAIIKRECNAGNGAAG